MAGLVEIKADLANLENDLKEHGIDVPKPPKTNHFGPKVKHVYKTRIKQAHPPDPLIVAVKGLNNLLRQWGKSSGQDGVSAPGSGSSRSGSSDAGYAGATPTALVGTEVAVVATLPLCTENSASDDDTFSDISADDIPA